MQAAVRAGRICTRRLSSASSQKQALAAQRYNQAVVDGIVKEKPVVLVNKTLIEHYATLLHERPLLTNATTSGVLCAVGDVLAQLIEWRASSSRTILEDSWEGSNRAPRAPASRRCEDWPHGHIWLLHLWPAPHGLVQGPQRYQRGLERVVQGNVPNPMPFEVCHRHVATPAREPPYIIFRVRLIPLTARDQLAALFLV